MFLMMLMFLNSVLFSKCLILTVLIKNSWIQCASVEVTLTAKSFDYNVTEDSVLIFLKLNLICKIYYFFIFLWTCHMFLCGCFHIGIYYYILGKHVFLCDNWFYILIQHNVSTHKSLSLCNICFLKLVGYQKN